MVAPGEISGPNAQIKSNQIASSFVVMQNYLGVQSRSPPESEAIDKKASIRMQRVLAEAWAEFGFEVEEEVPLSVYVEHYDKVCDGREAARAKDAADAAERLKMLQ